MTRGLAPAALLFAAGCLAGCAALAGDAPDAADRKSIRSVIEAQIAAFARDDAEAAFGFAAPGIQAKFGDASTFIAMVRAAYGPVYRPAEVGFLNLDLSGAAPVQHVLIVDSEGEPFLALYPMQRQPDGNWRIAGCVLIPWRGGRAGRDAGKPRRA